MQMEKMNDKNAFIDTSVYHKYEKTLMWQEAGYRFHFWYDADTNRHTHDFFEFFIITEGVVEHFYNGKTTLLSAGTLCVIRPGEVHQFMRHGNTKAVHFNCSVSQALFTSVCNSLSKFTYLSLCNSNHLLTYSLKESEFQYFLYLISLLNTFTDNASKQLTIVKTLLQNCLLCFINNDNDDRKYPDWFVDFINTVNTPEYFTKPISTLYQLVPYSQPRLNAYFHQYTNSTLVAYVTRLRINYSCNLLIFSDYPITLIAGLCGYNSLSHYNHTFKKLTGISPVLYRKQNLQMQKDA